MQTIYADRYRSRTHDFICIGPVPNDEECTQAGGDTEAMKTECKALINQLTRVHGTPPPGVEFCLIRNPHDFGTYYEAGLIFPQPNECLDQEVADGLTTQEEADKQEDANDKVWAYINKCEALPDTWDDDAKAELHTAEHPRFTAKIRTLKTA